MQFIKLNTTWVPRQPDGSVGILASIWDDPGGEGGDVIGVRRGLVDVGQWGLCDGAQAVGQRGECLL